MSAARRPSRPESKGPAAAAAPSHSATQLHPAEVLAEGSTLSPTAAHRYRFVAVEEASAVSRRAKALGCHGTCSSPAASCTTTRPGSCASTGLPAVGPAAAGPTPQAENTALSISPAPSPVPARFIDWESADEEGDEGGEAGSTAEAGQQWSRDSAVGSGTTTGAGHCCPLAMNKPRSRCQLTIHFQRSSLMHPCLFAEPCTLYCVLLGAGSLAGDELGSQSDPTIRLALALGLDPLELPMCGGPGIRSSSPAAGE